MKQNLLKVLIAVIFLAVFNVIFFFGGINRSDANWMSYGFITFSFLCLASTPLFAKGSTHPVLVGSLWMRASFYFAIELVVGFIFMVCDPPTVSWPLIIQGVMAGWFLIWQIMSVMANDKTTESLAKQKEESFARGILVDQLQQSYLSIDGKELKAPVGKALEALRNCPIETFPQALDADLAVSNAVTILCAGIESGDSDQIKGNATRLLTAIQNRNLVIRRCRQL